MKNDNINYFYVDKSEDPVVQAKNLRGFINNKLKNKNFSNFLNAISKNFSLPKETVEFETKQYLIRNHDFVNGKFRNIFNFTVTFKSLLIFILSYIFILIFSKKITLKKNVDIIYDECESENEINRVKNLGKHFKSYSIISPLNLKGNPNIFQFRKYMGCDRDFLLGNAKTIVLKNFFHSIYYSFSEKTNLVSIYLHIFKKLIKYETIFNQIQSKYLLQERHYTTSAIKNYIFKKKGGRITTCLQKNIIQIGETGFCINTDILFSLGKKGTEVLKFTDSQILKIIPAGSTFMENWLNLKKEEEKIYDLVNFAGNDVPLFAVKDNYMKNYYEHLRWLARLSKEYPELKIIIKHHSNNEKTDINEMRIIEGTSIRRVVKGESNNSINHTSYGYGINAKFICTWCSTIAYEFLGNKKPCFFLDPNLENNSWLHYENYNSFMRIGSYEQFKEKALDAIFHNKLPVIKNEEDFCLKSDNVSKIIYDNLKKNI